MPAPGQTQLDITTAIALLGLVVAFVSLFLTLRRDRAAGRVGVRMVVAVAESPRYEEDEPEFRVTFSNPERRTVTVQRAGLSTNKRDGREEFRGWDPVSVPSRDGHFTGMMSPFSGGLTFDPGDPAVTVTARMYRVRGQCFPDVARWVWCEDSIGGKHWERIPEDVRAAIASVKRHKLGPKAAANSGYRPSVEVEDNESVDRADLDIDSLRSD
jgi:hypothetical protein